MKKTNKILSVFLTLLMVFSIIPMASITASAATSGSLADKLTWTYNSSTKTLTISGTGEMFGFGDPDYTRPWADYEDEINTIVVKDGVTAIGMNAFCGCNKLSKVTLPNSIVSIGHNAFYDTGYYNNTSNWKNDVLYIGNHLIEAKRTISGLYKIKDGTITIADYAFDTCDNLTSITIPNSVTSIGDLAFGSCNGLTSITIPNSVTSIGDLAFGSCNGLTSITIPNSVTSIGNSVFSQCNGLTSVTLSNSLTKISGCAFEECNSLTKVTIPNSVTTIESYAFYACKNLTSVTFGNNVKTIEAFAFTGCDNLGSVTLPKSVTSIGEAAFASCDNLVSITVDIGNKNYSSDSYGVLFNKDKTKLIQYPSGNTRDNYTIPDSVTSIYYGAFSSASHLTSITIPKSVTFIDTVAFHTCLNLKDVYYLGSKEQWDNLIYWHGNTGVLKTANVHFIDIYNIGEETYNFKNFGDTDSPGGHCFGMSMTSAGYYNNILDITSVGGNINNDVYGLSLNNKVKGPICYYQDVQGKYANGAIVAGGKYYLNKTFDINSDWKNVINYVKNHNYDNKGTLQIGFRKDGQGGHAINFLRYEVVNGQERIYAYDNNFPDIETYFYKASDGKIYQAPKSTFNGSIDCIALRDVNKFFGLAKDYDAKRYIYGNENEVSISGATAYPMECGDESYMMFEIPDGVEQVVITPLVDNATFQYCDDEYSFGNTEDDTVGIFTLATDDDESMGDNFVITNMSLSIQNPSRTEIRNKDGIILHATVEGNAPAGSYVVWTSNNSNFDEDADGSDLTVVAKNKGYTTFTATLYDVDGNILMSDSVELYSKSGFFDKIGGFFRKLFGNTTIYEY